MKSTIILSVGLSLVGVAQAHMKMVKPPAIGTGGIYQDPNSDYNLVAPIRDTGDNFPCRGNHMFADKKARETYVAGQEYTLEIAGGAVHGGGSCQLALSYDEGATFRVIKSIIGGCPLSAGGNYVNKFKVPKSVPAGDSVIFSWSWINFTGTQEFYQNCARVKIENPAPVGNFKDDKAHPLMFVANIKVNGKPRMCVPDSSNGSGLWFMKYPEPGEQVEYGKNNDNGDANSAKVTELVPCKAA